MSKARPFPWYDAVWLDCYWQAYDIVSNHYPHRLDEFVKAFDCLLTPSDYSVNTIDKALTEQRLSQIKALIAKLPDEQLEKQELLSFGRLVVHDHTLFDEIHQDLTPMVSQLAGEPLMPSYSFLSLYNNLGICDLHLDAPNAKWTLDICIDQSAPWPIFIADPAPWPKPFEFGAQWQDNIKTRLKFNEYTMTPGQALLFSGSSQWHYRERIPKQMAQNYCHLLFLHFMPMAAHALVKPVNWANMFNMPLLANVTAATQTAQYGFSVKS